MNKGFCEEIVSENILEILHLCPRFILVYSYHVREHTYDKSYFESRQEILLR